MTALLIVAGVIAFLYAVPSPKTAPVTINVDRTTHYHVTVNVQNDNRVMHVALPQSATTALECLPRHIPTSTVLERYRQPQLPVSERKLLA